LACRTRFVTTFLIGRRFVISLRTAYELLKLIMCDFSLAESCYVDIWDSIYGFYWSQICKSRLQGPMSWSRIYPQCKSL